MPGPEHTREPFTGRIEDPDYRPPFTGTLADANYLPEQPAPAAGPDYVDVHLADGTHVDRVYTPQRATELTGVTGQVDPGAQAIVWAVTASAHAAEALNALTEQNNLRQETTAPDPRRAEVLDRQIEYHTKSHAVADKAAGMWALVASVFPGPDVAEDDLGDESGDGGKTDA